MKYKITYSEIPYGAGIFAVSEPVKSEIVETDSPKKLEKYITSKKDGYDNSYKKKSSFGFDYISAQGAVKVIEYKEPIIKQID